MNKKLTYADAGVDIDKADPPRRCHQKNRQENPQGQASWGRSADSAACSP